MEAERKRKEARLARLYGVSLEVEKVNLGGGIRGVIRGFSKAAVKRMRFVLRNTLCVWKSFVTLTYPKVYPKDGKVFKKHLKNFFDSFVLRFPGEKYFWFMEFQERGAVHYHIWTTVDVDLIYISGLKALWCQAVGRSFKMHETYGFRAMKWESRGAEAGYAEKYAKKSIQKGVPNDVFNPGRF